MVRSGVVVALACAACSFKAPPNQGGGDDAMRDAPPDTTSPEAGSTAFLAGYAHRKAFTLLGSKVTGTLADFPVVLITADAEILAGITQPAGEDVAFTTGDGTTVLASEVESLTATSLVAWIKIPNLAAGTDLPLYLYYGNPTPPTGDPTAVWSTGYLAVYHFENPLGTGNTGDVKDSTASHRNGTATGMTQTDRSPAKIGRGYHFNGNSGFVQYPQTDVGNTFTLSMWANLHGTGNSIKTMMANSLSGPLVDGFRWFVNDDGTADRRVLFETSEGTVRSELETNTAQITLDVFSQIVAVVDRTAGTGKIYVDGVDRTSTTADVRPGFATNQTFEVGLMGDAFFWNGLLDEVDIASGLRPPEWIATAFTNQSDPDAFHTPLGMAEDAPQ
jgi:hypothetical protein